MQFRYNESFDYAGEKREGNYDSDELEEDEEREAEKVKGSMDDEVDWYLPSERSLDGEKYGESFYEGEEVGEEEIPLSPAIASEKLEEARQVEESDHVLVELPAEVRINLSFSLVLPVELLFLTTFVIH